MNHGAVFRLPDQLEDVSVYPQSFHNDFNDEDSDSDIRTVKTNTSLIHGFPDAALMTTNISDEEDDDDVEARAVAWHFFTNRNDSQMEPEKCTRREQPTVVTPPPHWMAQHPSHTSPEKSDTNSSDDSRSSNDNEREFVDFSPINETLVEPMLLNMSHEDGYSSQEYLGDDSSYNYSLTGHGMVSPSGSSSSEEEETPVSHDTENAPKSSTNTEMVKEVTRVKSNPTIVNNDVSANDNNWIKSSWSYLQMMAKMTSFSPIPPKRDVRVVDLDDTVSHASTTNNTFNNDILSVNGGDDQRSYNSYLVHVAQLGQPDDTSTLPSAEHGDGGNDPSAVFHPVLTNSVPMIHGRTGSTLIVADGSYDEADSFMQQHHSTKESLQVMELAHDNLEDNQRSSKDETPSSFLCQRKRLCRWLLITLMILILVFAATELICTFARSCPQHLGYIQIHPDSSLKGAIPPPLVPSPSAVPTMSPVVRRPTQPPAPKPTNPDTQRTRVPAALPTKVPFFTSMGEVLVLNTTQELYDAVDLYMAEQLLGINASAPSQLPPIGEWDVSNVINMTSVFSAHRNPAMKFFHVDDLNLWNVSNVRYMRYMFLQAETFNGNVSAWDTSNVIDMHQTFASAYQFNQDISAWNVSRVQLMAEMFKNCPQFNQNIGFWDTGNVFSMQGMFLNAISFNQNLYWNTEKVQDMSELFEDADAFNGDVSSFNTSSVTNMRKMFRHAVSFTGINGLGSWQTTNVVDMSEMFLGASSFSGFGLSTWIVSSLQTINLMFAGAMNFNQNLCTNWHARLMLLDGTRNMFSGTSCPDEEIVDPIFPDRSNIFCVSCSLSPVGTLPPTTPGLLIVPQTPFMTSQELRNAVDAYMVDDSKTSIVAAQYGHPIGVWDVSRIADFSQLFDASRNTNFLNFDADLSGWNVSNAINMYAMFQQTVSFQDLNNALSRWDVSKVTDMSSMFASSSFSGDVSQWQVDRVTDFSFFAEFAVSFRSDVSMWNTSAAQDMGWMFRAAKSFQSNVSGWDISQVLDFSNLFAGASSFNQNLCSWGQQVTNTTNISFRNMLVGTSCPFSQIETNGTLLGPWCTPC